MNDITPRPTSPAAAPQSAAPALGLTLEQIKAAQNLPHAIAAGLISAIGASVLWAVVTVMTKMQIGYMAIAIGFIVGKAVRSLGNGMDQRFGYVGAACSLLGCFLGNIMSAIIFASQQYDVSITEILGTLTIDKLIKVITATFQPMDLVFYGIAAYEGFKLSFKYRMTQQPKL